MVTAVTKWTTATWRNTDKEYRRTSCPQYHHSAMTDNNHQPGFRAPKQEVLKENETISSFCAWQSSLLFYLSENNKYAWFLDPTSTWQRKSITNRGLVNDQEPVPEGERKTAAQKNIVLERMLAIIAQFSPPLLRNDIIKKSTSLSWIWQRIRKHYSFSQSEVNFLRLNEIRREPDERYETLFQRIVAHLDDNLLTTTSNITHDGERITVDEEMSPTVERLAVYLWLTLIDARLPSFVSRVYAHDLASKSLKDIQPQICDAMNSLLAEMNSQEDSITVNYSRSLDNNNRRSNNNNNYSNRRSNNNNNSYSKIAPPIHDPMLTHVITRTICDKIPIALQVSTASFVRQQAKLIRGTISRHAGLYPSSTS